MKGSKCFAYLLALVMVLVSGCATYPQLEADAELPSDHTYLIGPGDTLEVFVWGNPDVSRAVPVRPDGKISAPLIEELMASGKTPYDLAREVEKELETYIRNPFVTIIVTQFVGPYSQQVRVVGRGISSGNNGGSRGGRSGGGGGRSSGSGSSSGSGGSEDYVTAMTFPYRLNMTLLDLMIAVGGISDYADGNRASLVRSVDGERQQFSVRIEDLMENGDMTANVDILPGDILFVPEAYF